MIKDERQSVIEVTVISWRTLTSGGYVWVLQLGNLWSVKTFNKTCFLAETRKNSLHFI